MINMESFAINENLIVDQDEYFIFDDDVSSSSLEDNDQSYTESEEEHQPVVTVIQPSYIPASTATTLNLTQRSSNVAVQQQQESKSGNVTAYLKPAKGREDQYTVGDFPVSLLCNPYKYDLKLVGEINPVGKRAPMNSISDLLNQQRKANQEEGDFLLLTLVDADTMAAPQLTSGSTPIKDKKDYLSVESITKIHNKERVIRFTFNLCSFHVKRRSFRLVVQNKNSGESVFVSSPFKTFARRRDQNNAASNRQAYQQNLMNNMYFMQESPKKSRRAVPYPQVSAKMNRYSPSAMIPVASPEMQADKPNQTPAMFAPMAMYPVNPLMYSSFQSGYTYPIESLLHNLGPQERTSLAIQLMSSLTPVERETVDFYLSCSGQSFAMGGHKQEDTEACFVQASTQSQVHSRV